MNAAQGILTARGGMTSHAAVVARGMGKCCVAGCSDLVINYEDKTVRVGDRTFGEGDYLTIDGGTGEVFTGQIEVMDPEMTDDFNTIMEWAQEEKTMMVKTNAEEPHEIQVALKYGAEGIGLCRTEHMFFEEQRIKHFREMIVAQDQDARDIALEKLEPL
jgi:pyruvate,orthophosphate dikinase